MTRSSRSFGPKFRLKKRAEFLNIQARGAKSRTKHFLLIAQENGADASRVGVTVTTKIDKRAVRRNFIKRRVREFFRLNRDRIGTSSDIVVVALRGANELTGEKIRGELHALFSRCKALNYSRSGGRR